jgi:hypothetical protein
VKTGAQIVQMSMDGQTLIERVHSTTELLELVAADRSLLDQVPFQDRERFHRAVADFIILTRLRADEW